MLQVLPAPRTRPARIQRSVANPLETRVRRSLCSSPYGQLRIVRCRCEAGAVQLLGTLPSFFLKQMAQETAKRIVGAMKIDNQVVVKYAEGNTR